MRKHRKWLFESPMADDEDKARLASLLYSVLLASLITAIIYALFVILSIPERITRFPIFAAIMVLELVAYYLLRRGIVRLAGLLFVFAFWIIVTLVIVISGGVSAPAFSLYVLVILMAGLLFGGRIALSVAALSILSGTLFIYLQSTGKLPELSPSFAPYANLGLQSLSFFLTAFLLFRASRSVAEAIARSRRGEEALETLLGNLSGVAYRCKNDPNWTFEYTSDGIYELTGYHPADFVETQTVYYGDLIHPEDRSRVWNEVQQAIKKRRSFQILYRIRTAQNNEEKWVWEQGQGLYDLAGNLLTLEGLITDITVRMRAEQALEKANRAYRVLSGCNQAVVRATDEAALLQDVCQTIVDLGGYQQVWVGLIDPAAQAGNRTIQPAAQAGNHEHFLDNLMQIWDRDGGDCRPVDRVIATGKPKVVKDVQTDPACNLCRNVFEEIDCASLIILPLKANHQTLGTLNVYSANAGDFTDEEVALLTELAGDLAYGIMALRIRAEREQTEAALRDSERKFRTIFDETLDVILVINGETGEILSANHAANRVLGYAVDDLIGKSFMSMFFGNDEATVHSWIGGDSLPQSEDLILQFRRADGTACPMDLTATLIHWADDFAVLAVLRDITEWQKMEEAERLRAELEQERELIELKENFVAVVSHQFRTPLTVVLSANELLENYFDRLPPEKRLKYIQQIKRQVNYMTSLLDDVLFMSRASRGKLEYRPGVLDLETFVQDELSKLEFVDNGAHEFIFEVSGKFDNLVLDEKLLQHILTNLLSNAIKYTPQGKEIRVELTKEDTTAVMRVCDQGMGIPDHDQHRLFEPFHRAANAREISGTGLGLTIVKESVTMHGGTIEFESHEGSGTTFTVRLPYIQNVNGSSALV